MTDTDTYESVEPVKKNESVKKSESFLQKLNNIPSLLKKKKSEAKDEPQGFQIPASGNIIEFNVEEMCQFFSCFNSSYQVSKEKDVDAFMIGKTSYSPILV
ncbi:Hypothetical predicted protein [Octopus vulgaris]|uniref:Uncharacterized protein n=1 Tax=Octopus vulgaris TaxID=6645 RepID=A0AA36B2T5_OCTVU|nr:Hypothetical predicted protein [Octopus vulgaris]